MTDDELMREILTSTQIIAVVGASDKTHRASYGVMKFLQSKSYRCIPVSPRLAGGTLLGEPAYARLADIPEPVDMVDMFINSQAVGALTDDAIAIGAKSVWMQLGVVDDAAAGRARAAGLKVVMDHCPAQEWDRLGL
ncbi:MAG: CoA-binding protein [Gammaproteobacteria bacterium]